MGERAPTRGAPTVGRLTRVDGGDGVGKGNGHYGDVETEESWVRGQPVGEPRGALRGVSPRTREGRRPDRPEEWSAG